MKTIKTEVMGVFQKPFETKKNKRIIKLDNVVFVEIDFQNIDFL